MNESSFYKLYSVSHSKKDTTLFSTYEVGKRSPIKKENTVSSQKSLFTGHELQITNPTYVSRQQNNLDVVFPILVFDLVLLIIIFSLYRKQLVSTVLSFFSSKHYQQIDGKSSIIFHPVGVILFLASLLNIALLLEHNYNIDFSFGLIDGWPRMISYMIILGGFYILKSIFILLSGGIFNVGYMAKVYIDYIIVSAMNFGILLSFTLWFEMYLNPPFLFPLLILLWVVLACVRIIQTYARIIPKSDFKLFQFFLYLCTVEILPLIVLGKLVMIVR